jgi:glucokinase
MKNQHQVLAFDLGGTFLRCGLSSQAGQLTNVQKHRLASIAENQSASDIWSAIEDTITRYIAELRDRLSPQASLVLSFPGPVAERRVLLNAPTVVGSSTRLPDLHARLTERTQRPVAIINDLTAGAWYCSTRTDSTRFMVVTVSSGIGSKIFDRQHPHGVLDTPPWAGEIGHVVVDDSPEAPRCDCGALGHLGAIASGRGVERFARREALVNPAAFQGSAVSRQFGATPEHLENETHLVPAALAGDPWALDIIRKSARPLARLLLEVSVATGLERIILIGGFALVLGPLYRDLLQDEMARHAHFPLIDSALGTLLELGDVDEEACLLGAAIFGWRVRDGTGPQ